MSIKDEKNAYNKYKIKNRNFKKSRKKRKYIETNAQKEDKSSLPVIPDKKPSNKNLLNYFDKIIQIYYL